MGAERKRDRRIDVLRGTAALIVVIGHVLQRFQNYEDFLLFNVIFSVQMPLFMMLSGYSKTFGQTIASGHDYCKYLFKRARTLLIPWLVWCVIAYLLLDFNRFSPLEYIITASHNMEIVFWFLFSLWTIDLLFSTASFISKKISQNKESNSLLLFFLIEFVGFICGVFILFLIGRKLGFTFLGIKYSIYYSAFFLLGIYIGRFKRNIELLKPSIKDVVFAICVVIYAVMIPRYNIMHMSDNSFEVVIRVAISTLACIIAFGIVNRISISESAVFLGLEKLGMQTMEMYVIHFFVVRLLDTSIYKIDTAFGFCIAIMYMVIVVLITLLVIRLLNMSNILMMSLFGKKSSFLKG